MKISIKKKISDNKKLLVFDFDGTIVKSNHIKTEAFGQLYRKFGKKIERQVVDYHLNNQGVDRYKKISHFQSNFLNKEMSKTEINKIADDFSNLVKNKVISSEFIPGAIDFLEFLISKNVFCTINTATPDIEINEILIKKKIDKYFSMVLGSSSNKIDNLKKILSEFNFKKKEIVCLGDSSSDIEAAEYHEIDFIKIGVSSLNKKYKQTLFEVRDFREIIE